MATGESFAAVVLAAGQASRFGGGKLLAVYAGRPLLHHALAAAKAAPVGEVVVVTGADAEAVAACAHAFDPALRMVYAPDHAEGMSASLRAGVAALSPAAGAFIFLGDMPRVPHAILPALADAVRGGAMAAAPEFAGRRGNPVLLSQALFPVVGDLRGDTGARALLQGLGPALARVETDGEGVLFDVDQPSDLARR
mgnify:CR=1 FL=1